jgi:hypothetical protein
MLSVILVVAFLLWHDMYILQDWACTVHIVTQVAKLVPK